MSIGRFRARVSARAGSEAGFSLIELLVVILIIGILAGIAIPAFLSQKEKAVDASAKEQARTAQTAVEAYSTDHVGSYSGVSVAAVQAIEPTLKDASTAELIVVESLAEGRGYIVESKSVGDGNTYTVERTATDETVRSCAPEGHGGCPKGGHW